MRKSTCDPRSFPFGFSSFTGVAGLHTIAGALAALAALTLAGGTAQAQPFDELHCHRVRDTQKQEAAIALLRDAQVVPDSCTLDGRAVHACTAVRSHPHSSTPPAETADGSILFDRLCYAVSCDDDSLDQTAQRSDKLGDHELHLGKTRQVCLPAALGDLDDLIARSDPAAAGEARKRTGRFAGVFELATCGDFTGDGTLTATDALGVLRTAVGTGTCLPCVCDVDMSGAFTATDALATLQFVVGLLGNLNCQPDGNMVTWDGGGDGTSWSDPLNWSLDTRIPNACDDVRMATGAIVTVEHDSGSNQAMRVTSLFPFDMDAGTLTIRDTIQVSNTFRFTGGTLADALVQPPNSAVAAGLVAGGTVIGGVTFTSSGGVLDNVTMNAAMDMTASGARINIDNGLALNGTATMGSSTSMTFRSASSTLTGNGEIFFATSGTSTVSNSAGTNLVIDSGVTIRGLRGQVGNNSATATMTNNGTINSNETGNIDIRGGGGWTNENQVLASNGGGLRLYDTWTNNGSIDITGGGTLRLDGNWDNAGTISMTDSTVQLAGTFTLADLGTFNRSGGTVDLIGTFDNASNLTLDATTGNWNLSGGTIQGGAVMQADGAEMIFTSSGGLLDGVTFDAPMNFSNSSARVNIDNDLTLNGTATMGSSTSMTFRSASSTLTGNAEIFFATNGTSTVSNSAGTNLVIDSGVTIRGLRGQVGNNSATATMTNNGIIDSDETGNIDIRGGGGWTNNGTLRCSGGNIRTFETWMNNGTIEVGAGNKLEAATGLTLATTSELTVDIAGSSSFGLVQVTGNANINGDLTINLTGGFDPGLGESFVILTSTGAVAGGFDSVTTNNLGAGKQFQVDIGATSITLTVVSS